MVTGGGSGMGRELVVQLAAQGCHVAACDVTSDTLEETRELALGYAPSGTRVVTVVADVADEPQLVAFRDAVTAQLATDHLNLLFNNAGIAGGGSFVADDRAEWERTFAIDWGGVYLGTRTFLPLLLAADEGHVINTSSINGLWASIGPGIPHTAYSTAKFAIRGFTEALITDFSVHAPHLRASVAMPGHIGTSIITSTGRAFGRDPLAMDDAAVAEMRSQLTRSGVDLQDVPDETLRQGARQVAENFRDRAPTSAARAASIILDGVRQNRWRILVGDDAELADVAVRAEPERVYDLDFWEERRAQGLFSSWF